MKKIFWLIVSIALLVFLTGISQAQKPTTVKHHYVYENGKWVEYQVSKTTVTTDKNTALSDQAERRRQALPFTSNEPVTQRKKPMDGDTKTVIWILVIIIVIFIIAYFESKFERKKIMGTWTEPRPIVNAPPVTPPQQPAKALPDEDYTKGTGLDIPGAIEKGADVHIIVTPFSRETIITQPKNKPPVTNNDNRKITNIHQANTSQPQPKDLPGGGEKPRGNGRW